MEQIRLIMLVESRIRGDVYVRFGGEYLKTYHSNMIRRWVLSLLWKGNFVSVVSFPSFNSFSISSPAFTLRLLLCSMQLITNIVRAAISLCVNIIERCFVAQIAIDAMGAFVGVNLKWSMQWIERAKLAKKVGQLLATLIVGQCYGDHFVCGNLIESYRIHLISHFHHAEILSP